MKTVFVKYHKIIPSCHAMLDDELVECSEIIEIENLLDLNIRYKRMIDVKVLNDDGNTNIHSEENPFTN